MADEQQRKAQARAQRFANDAKKPPPPPPKKTFAAPGRQDDDEQRGGAAQVPREKRRLPQRGTKTSPGRPAKEGPRAADAAHLSKKIARTNYLSGICPYKLDDQKLGALFASRYHVIGSKIVLDRQTNRGRGFGFVTFGSSEDAKAAHDAFQGVKVEGRLLTVKYATQRGQKTPEAGAAQGRLGLVGDAVRRRPSTGRRRRRRPPKRLSPRNRRRQAGSQRAGRLAPEAASAHEAADPLESETPVEAVTLWKIATSSEVEAWRAAGALTGSALDEKGRLRALRDGGPGARRRGLVFCGATGPEIAARERREPAQGHDVDAGER